VNPVRKNIIRLAVLPLLLAIATIGALLWFQMQRLEARQEQLQEDVFMTAKRAELRNYVHLGLSSIDHLYGAGRDDEAAKIEAKAILRTMNFGDDGYFFVYDTSGRNLVHPRQPELEGQQLIDLRDGHGVPVVRELLARAREGGGFQRYEWGKPSSGHAAPKLGYAVMLERWGWMVGTGLYLDDIDAAAVRMRQNLLANVYGTLIALAALGVVATLAVFAGGMALNISEQRMADRKISELAERVVVSQEQERARVSRELHDHVCQQLVSIKYRFELAVSEAARDASAGLGSMHTAIAALAGAIGDVRRISHDLRPAHLDDLGAAAALQLLGADFARRTGLQVRVQAVDPEPMLSAEQVVELFRIAQEALLNVERHAAAQAVDMRLDAEDGAIVLSIRDDGRGFDVARADRGRGGIGLSNIRQRATRLGARLMIHSNPGQTLLEVVLPKARAVTGMVRA
jgi:two-component system, NarL family, sensor kinase